MSIYDKEYLADVDCWNCQSPGSVEWRDDHYYCRACGQTTSSMVPVILTQGGNTVKEWKGTGFIKS